MDNVHSYSYRGSAKADPRLDHAILDWKRTGIDIPVSGLLEIVRTPEAKQQFLHDIQAAEIEPTALAEGFYTFYSVPISRLAHFLEQDPSYLKFLELSRRMSIH